MGGASSYIAMLSIAGFLGAAWTASKVSRLLGISSIVLEITVGVALGPRGFGLVDPVYTVCETKRVDDCTAPADLDDRISKGLSLGPSLGRIVGMGVCNPADYSHGDHGHSSHGSGLFNMTVDYVGGAQPMEESHADDHSGGHSNGDHGSTASAGHDNHADTHSESHADTSHSESHSSDSHDSHDSHDGHASDGHASQHRRLSGGHYHSYSECLVKECEHEVSNNCGSFPDFFTLIGHAGVGLMIFESGMHFDFEKAKIVGLPACCVAVLGTVLPLIVGSLLTVMFGRPFMPDGISAGTALAPTSVGIALRLLGEAGVLQENFGQAIITAAFVDDILSLVLFNVLFSLGGEFDMFKTVIAPIIGVAFMLFAMYLAVNFWPKFLPKYILARVPQKSAEAKISAQDEALFFFMFALLFVYATITHFLGTHLWGCFIAGMSFACLNPPHHAHHVWVKQTKRVTSWMIRIFFAGTVAFTIPLQQLMSIDAFWKGSIMGIFACIGTKVICAPFMGKARWVIGWAMVGRAEFAYLIAQMALSAGMLDAGTFSIVIWALLYATIFAPFIFRLLLNRYVASEGLGEGAAGTGFSDSDSDIWGEEKENNKKEEDDLEDGGLLTLAALASRD
ncbi:gerT [Symbiodinium pilosum]|uniref:GerT protein n=1 Tax=Symbiodinium pilosum TaxID=2952 RepID=A0A812YDU7_SYMPI|nr:gerT [Symbiodinium pilosum]